MMNNFKQISTDGEFTLWADSPVYKTHTITGGYIRNTKTGENCGKEVKLYKHYYQDGVKLASPIYDEDCYEFVFEV
jgi:hypothetical protein